ncbi:MAG: reductive dehalogenase [Candidatus Thermoplasmatota archaeon]|jgi:hypothetical protein|nr:reductive dehalogenase [Candidatus Thermoplasmatota archaeon]
MAQELESSIYKVDSKVHKRFDQRMTVFGRMLHDESADYYGKGMYERIEKILSKYHFGYTRLDHARVMGAWTAYDYFHEAFSWEKMVDANSVMKKAELEKYPVSDIGKMSEELKNTAKFYGASLVGITRLDHRWIYSRNRDGKEIEIPAEYKFAVVMAIGMDPLAISTSPAFTACAETAIGYSRMATCVGSTAEFIRSLGYNAIPMGNDTALSIPMAIDAGLGEMGRNGLLITKKYGSCIRLCKIFTDMPLKADKPIRIGVAKFCRKCKKCAEACVAGAIRSDMEPSYEISCPSNNPGIMRWAVDQDKCYRFWIKNGGDCSNCIAACPFFPKI